MSTLTLLIYVSIMAGVTYFIRALPMILCKKRIKNVFLLSFLHYVPYAVLGSMTFPAIFFSTGGIWSALVGLSVSLILAFCKRSLTTVALFSSFSVFVVEWFLY